MNAGGKRCRKIMKQSWYLSMYYVVLKLIYLLLYPNSFFYFNLYISISRWTNIHIFSIKHLYIVRVAHIFPAKNVFIYITISRYIHNDVWWPQKDNSRTIWYRQGSQRAQTLPDSYKQHQRRTITRNASAIAV